jgi:hypothetical protein
MAYIKLIVTETQEILDKEGTPSEIRDRYALAYNDWKNTNKSIIGDTIYGILETSEGVAVNVYAKIRTIYEYYQSLYLSVQAYQIVEESDSLNV